MSTVVTFEESPFAGTPVSVPETIADLQVLAHDLGLWSRVTPDAALHVSAVAPDDVRYDVVAGRLRGDGVDDTLTVCKGRGGDEGRGWYVDGEYFPTARAAARVARRIIRALAA